MYLQLNLQRAKQANPCQCVDCGGTEPGHSNDCTYMRELFPEEVSEGNNDSTTTNPKR